MIIIKSQYNTLKPSNIREANIKQIIKIFRLSSELMSRAEISRKISLSAPSVSSIISNLIDANILFERQEGRSSSSGGRRPIMLELNKDCGFIIGVYIKYEELIIVLVNYKGEIVDKDEINYFKEFNSSCEQILINSIEVLLKNNDVEKEKILSIGVAIPGVFDNEDKVIKFAPNIKTWENMPIKEELKNAFDCEVIVENAVNTAVLGEKLKGKINGKENAIYIKIDKGIGAGVLINGKLYEGFKNLAGEIGFMVSTEDMLLDKESEYGSLEKSYSIKAICEQANDFFPEENIDFSKIVEKANEGDEKINKLLDNASTKIALTIANIICVISPEIVVIGGMFNEIAPIFINKINNIIERIVPVPPKIVLSELGDKVYYTGAIVQSLDDIESKLINKYIKQTIKRKNPF